MLADGLNRVNTVNHFIVLPVFMRRPRTMGGAPLDKPATASVVTLIATPPIWERSMW